MHEGAPPSSGRPSALVRLVASVLRDSDLRSGTLLVAVSGGPDSTALLHALATVRSRTGLSLHVAHIDHGIRAESGRDAELVEAMAESLGVPCTVEKVAVRRGTRSGRASEGAAREARYAALTGIAREVGASAVALGHTADDQAETVLLHLVRGSGLAGLGGMAPLSLRDADGGPAVVLVRPLLRARRSETWAYCERHGLTPLVDETNLDTSVPRNLVRLEVVPALARINPRVVDALNRMASSARRDVASMEGRALEAWPALVHAVPRGLQLDRTRLLTHDAALQRHLLRAVYAQVGGGVQGLHEVHIERLVRLAAGPSGRSASLPGGVLVETTYGQLTLVGGSRTECALPPLEGEHELPVPGDVVVGPWRVRSTIEHGPVSPNAGRYCAVLDASVVDAGVVGAGLSVRPRRRGDRFQPLGLGGHSKSLQDFFVDAHVPRSARTRTPLVVAPGGVAWVVGWRVAEWARVTPETERVLRLEFYKGPHDGHHD